MSQHALNKINIKDDSFQDRLQDLIEKADHTGGYDYKGNFGKESTAVAKAFRALQKDLKDPRIDKVGIDDLNAKLEGMSEKYSAVGLKAKAAAVGQQLFVAATSMAVAAAVSFIATKIVDYFQDLANAQEDAIQKGSETAAEFSKQKDALNSVTSTIDKSGERFIELSKGVSLFGDNLSLTSAEFKEYNQLATELGETFPSLVSGYTDLGVPIITAKTSVEELNKALAEQKKLLNDEIIGKASDYVESFNAKNNNDGSGFGAEAGLKQQKERLDSFTKVYNDTKDIVKAKDALIKSMSISGEEGDIRTITDPDDFLRDIEEELGLEFINNFTDRIDEKALAEAMPQIKEHLRNLERQTEAAIAEMKPLVQAYLENSGNYSGLTDQTKSMVSNILSSIDNEFAEANFFDKNGNISFKRIQDWSNELTKDLSKKDVQDNLSKMFEIDSKKSKMSFRKYKDQMGTLIRQVSKQVDGLSKNHLSKMFNFDKDGLTDFSANYQRVFDIFGRQMESLSNEDLELGKLILDDGFSGTFNEFKQQIALAKKEKEDLNATPLMDEYDKAKETKNAGDNYVKMLADYKQVKENHKAGLVGMDEQKGFYKWLSPTGADDPMNFQENMPKFERYFTESSEGVQNFLNDLKALGKADVVNDEWKWQIEDLEETATQLGIGLEPLLSIFGRLEDYGFSNNFVSSIEDGKTHLVDLYSKLSETKANLIKLEAEGADNSAIEAEKRKVRELEAAINDTKLAMDALTRKSADDYANEVKSTKEAIKALKAERDKIKKEQTYGADTDSVVKMMDSQIEEWASEKSIQLDAQLNIVEENTTFNSKRIDLGNRPVVTGEKMFESGWKDFEGKENSTSTVYSSSFSNEAGDKTILVTPILPDGEVLTPEALEEYANGILAGNQDSQGLVIDRFYGEDSVKDAENYATALHAVQEAYYSGSDAQKEALSAFKDYSAEQLKSIDLFDEQYSTLEGDFLRFLYSLNLSKENGSQLIDILSEMGLIKINPLEQVETDLQKAIEYRDSLYNTDGTLNCDTSELEKANEVILELINQKITFSSEPYILKVDSSQLEGTQQELTKKLQEFQTAWNNFTFLDEQKKAGLEVDDSQLVDASRKVEGLRKEIEDLGKNNPKLTAELGLDPVSSANLAASIKEITPEIFINATDKTLQPFQSANQRIDSLLKREEETDIDITATDKVTPVVNTILESLDKLPTEPQIITIKENTVKQTTFAPPVFPTFGKVEEAPMATGTMLSPAHVSGTAYNVLNMTPAYANGKVALTKNEEALVNEMGTESIIRDGVWSLIPGGMHKASLKKGDIILNAKQTTDLIKTGKALGHGKAYADGTISKSRDFATPILSAYAAGAGGGAFWNASTGKYQATHDYKKEKDKNKKRTDDAKKAAEEALKAITDYFDWIKVRFDRLARNTKIAEDAIEKAVGLFNKQSATSNTISKVQAEKNAAQQGANRYLSHANWFANEAGLSSDIQSKVQNGTIDIVKYDEITQKKIQEYQKYYEEYLSALDKITELQNKEIELAQSKLSNVVDFYDLITSVHEAVQQENDALLNLEEMKGFSAVSDSVRKVYESSMYRAQIVYDNAVKQLNDYQNEFNALMKSGYIKQGSDEYYEAQKQIVEFRQAVSDAASSVIEFEDKIREIEYQKLQNVIDGLERSMSKLDKWISLQESRDEKVDESVYQEQLDTNNKQILANKELRDKKLKEQSLYDVGSNRYQELAEEINSLDESTLDLLQSNEELKNSIFELRFADLDNALEQYGKLKDEISDFQSLLDEDAFFDKNGVITDEGLANLALLQQGMATSKQAIADYRVGLEKLQESFDNGVISEKEYNDKSEEYRDGIRDSIKDVKDYEDSLVNLYMTQMKTEVDALQKVIDKRKEALDKKAEYYDYDKKIKSQSKDVNQLKAEIAALEGVTLIALSILYAGKPLEPYIKDWAISREAPIV